MYEASCDARKATVAATSSDCPNRFIGPQDVLDQRSLIPRIEDIVVYCTGPGDKTSRIVLRRALALGFTRIKYLTGGLAAWKTKGCPVEPYRESFRLSVPTEARPAG